MGGELAEGMGEQKPNLHGKNTLSNPVSKDVPQLRELPSPSGALFSYLIHLNVEIRNNSSFITKNKE